MRELAILFSVKPKATREGLYDRETELNEFKE
ncbi:hypothetical protein Vsou_09610 [Vulcanisaeta souniana JCM 11219]|uniref:Uncharacterized protein n=1 Tax=Vulcanisaeta souniana JCM 11219 TaxID=1293586 RepID=A0ABM8BLL4_9CREN|nr:hypothetical protein Vsou_09610 [Vulcanisaeta souniana JCM 11219]